LILDIKGAKVSLVIFDSRYNTYVKFDSKADLSEYLWGDWKRTSDLSRYLARFENKSPVLFKKTLRFYQLSELTNDINVINVDQYYNLIGSNRYIHKE